MRSLRTRLIVGSALVAVVPLAVAMYLLSQRVEAMVRTEAADRLSAALGGLEERLRADGKRMEERLLILGRDPALKRLYLLRPAGSRDLSEYMVERRFLLGLDLLELRDMMGTVVADGATTVSPLAEDRLDSHPVPLAPPGGDSGLGIERLADSSGLAMVARAPIRYEAQAAGILQGGTVLDAGFLSGLKRSSGMELVLRDGEDRVVASTLPDSGTPAAAPREGVRRVQAGGRSYLSQSFPLSIGAPPLAGITGMIPTESADRTVATLQITSALLGGLGIGIAVFLGILWSSQVSRPVERLASYSRKLAQGEWDEPLKLHSVREIATLVSALDRMRRDLTAYRERLVVSERQAAWSQMARKVAHEIKNPLTPIAVSVADLKRSYEQQRADFPGILDQAVRTIADEVETLKRLLSEFSDFARLPAPRFAPCSANRLLADLEVLYGGEVASGRLTVARPDTDITVSADAGQMRQALVNLVQNGLEAAGGDGRVSVSAAGREGGLWITVSDTGPGLSEEQKSRLFTPGFTTKTQGSGLGLTIVERIVYDHRGTITVDSEPGGGTEFRIRLPLAPEA